MEGINSVEQGASRYVIGNVEPMPIRLAQVHLISQGRGITDLTAGRAFEHP